MSLWHWVAATAIHFEWLICCARYRNVEGAALSIRTHSFPIAENSVVAVSIVCVPISVEPKKKNEIKTIPVRWHAKVSVQCTALCLLFFFSSSDVIISCTLTSRFWCFTDFCSFCSRCSIFWVAIFSWSLAAADNLKCGRFDAISAEYCSLKRGAYSAKKRCSIKLSSVGRCFWHASFDSIDSSKFSVRIRPRHWRTAQRIDLTYSNFRSTRLVDVLSTPAVDSPCSFRTSNDQSCTHQRFPRSQFCCAARKTADRMMARPAQSSRYPATERCRRKWSHYQHEYVLQNHHNHSSQRGTFQRQKCNSNSETLPNGWPLECKNLKASSIWRPYVATSFSGNGARPFGLPYFPRQTDESFRIADRSRI